MHHYVLIFLHSYVHDLLVYDCSDILQSYPTLYGQDGIYNVIFWNTSRFIPVYCDMTTDGGGWTVFQNRHDGSVDFYRNYTEYVRGFGDLYSEFWLGLDYIQEMTSRSENELRIDLKSVSGRTAYEVLDKFFLLLPDYTLNVGNTTDSMNISEPFLSTLYSDVPFSTFDHDVDADVTGSCAMTYHGAWWYKSCYNVNLNGDYLTPGTKDMRGIVYNTFITGESLKETRMAFREVH